MPKEFSRESQNFVYYNDYSATIPKQTNGKMNVIDGKPAPGVTDSAEDSKKNPTPRDVLNDFFESTSVHGLQYFGKMDIKVGVFGKILWTCTMLTGFICLSLMVVQFLRRYADNPTNTFIKDFFAPIFEAPFPAVTICPFMPIPKHRRLAVMENLIVPENLSTEIAMEILKYGHYITLPYGSIQEYKQLDELKLLLKANGWSLLDFLKILRPCEDLVESCWWSNERIDCVSSFRTSHSSFGLCCSFNYLLEDFVGHAKNQPRPRPLHSVTFGRKSGLKLIIKKEMLNYDSDSNTDSNWKTPKNDGLLVLIHHSMDYPGLNTDSRILQKNHELEISVRPEVYKKPVGLYHYNREHGVVPVCVSDNENVLDYFPTYRYSNCYANCRVREMLRTCGCVPFIYDYLAQNYNLNRCEVDGLTCIQQNMKKISIVRDTIRTNFSCYCRTPCEDVTYEGFSNMIALTLKSSYPLYANMTSETAVLRIFMNSQVFQILETIPAADETYLLASIGGIFSLFLGSSFLSLVEIVYFSGLMCRAIYSGRKMLSRKKRTRYDDFVRN